MLKKCNFFDHRFGWLCNISSMGSISFKQVWRLSKSIHRSQTYQASSNYLKKRSKQAYHVATVIKFRTS